MKKNLRLLGHLSVATILASSCQKNIDVQRAAAAAPVSSALALSEYTYFGGDEFNGTTLDTSIWDLRRENDPSFPSPNTRSNITVSNGILQLVTKQPPAGPASSAEISTDKHFAFRYGYFEIRAQLSSGVGGECAFWLQTTKTLNVSNPFDPTVSGVEIDVFENGIAQGINKIFHSLHWNGYDPGVTQFVTVPDSIPGIYNGFHTFALEWTPQKYVVYVDGLAKATATAPISRTPEFIILGTGPGGFGGNGTLFPNPNPFLVDYIHVYTRRPEVTLYGDAHYVGWTSNGLLPGTYSTAQLVAAGAMNNALSSLEIPAGWTVKLFDGDNLTGQSVTLNSGDTSNLPAFNDRTSSIQIIGN